MSDAQLERLFRYLEGKCTPAEQAEVEQQLADDPSLASWVSYLPQSEAWMKGRTLVQAPDSLFANTFHQYQRTLVKSAPWAGIPRLGWIIMGLTLVFFGLSPWGLRQLSLAPPVSQTPDWSPFVSFTQPQTLMSIGGLLLSMCLLLVLDRWLARKWKSYRM